MLYLTSSCRGTMIHGDGILQLLIVPCHRASYDPQTKILSKMLPKCLLSSREKKNILFCRNQKIWLSLKTRT